MRLYRRIVPRSGLAVKHMLDVGAGVIDPDFSGEVRVMLFNHSDYEFRIQPGDRIAQLILEKVMIVDAKITVKQPDVTVRGVNGFGSTGGYPAGPAIGLSGDPTPPMPRSNKASGHQPNLQGIPTFYACVARPVTKKEQAGNDKARAALLKEWTKLRKLGCWDDWPVIKDMLSRLFLGAFCGPKTLFFSGVHTCQKKSFFGKVFFAENLGEGGGP